MTDHCNLNAPQTRASLYLQGAENPVSGRLIGSPQAVSGELVFTTGMVGYCEAITDPSYKGQILIFSYPLIGNYGIAEPPESKFDITKPGYESLKAQVAGVIMNVDSAQSFHWTGLYSLHDWLLSQGVPALVGLDTRALVQEIRSSKNLLAKIIPENEKESSVDYRDPGFEDVLPLVSTKEVYRLGKGKKRVAVIDCGVKWNILRQLVNYSCEVELHPWDSKLANIDADAFLVSNGPGDPARAEILISQLSNLIRETSKPILGICLGHQLLSLAAGAKTYRMSYGHRSHNQPVYVVGTKKGFMTSQNHGYVVDSETIPEDWDIWFRNVNDESVEGLRHKTKNIKSVQFHPEAAGGPRDTSWIMQEFVESINASR